VHINPGTGGGTRRHGKLFQSGDSSLKRCGIVSSKGADIVRAEDRDEEMEFALVDELVDDDRERERVDRSSSRRSGNEKWNWVREDGVEGRLRVKEIKGAEIRRAGGASGGEDSCHARREKRGGCGSRGGTENEVLELSSGEQGKAIGVIISKGVPARGGAKSSELIAVKSVEGIRSNSGRGARRRRGTKVKTLSNVVVGRGVGRGGGGRKSRLGKGEPEIERERRKGEPIVEGRRVDSRAKSKIRDTVRASRGVGGNSRGDGVAIVVAKTESDQIVDEEESRTNGDAAIASLKRSVVGATGDMAESGD
jgi:hypothetical protein